MAGIEFALFVLKAFLLVGVALLRGQGFQDFPFPISVLVFSSHCVPLEFEPIEFRLKLLPLRDHGVPRDYRKLEFSCASSNSEGSLVQPGGIRQRLFHSSERFPSARNREAGFLQTPRPLPLQALSQT